MALRNTGGGGGGDRASSAAAAAPPAPAAPAAPAPASAPRRPGRPRSEQVEDAILDAVIALLSEDVSYDLLSMETIAGKAGVGKAAIYRRWANKEALVLATLARTFHATPRRVPEGASVREDLIDLMKQMRTNITETQEGMAFAVLLQTLASNRDLMYRYQEAVIEPRREQYREVLRRGVANGEMRPDLDVERATVMLTSTLLFVCKLYPTFEVTEDYCVGLVDDLLRGAASKAEAPRRAVVESKPAEARP
jgi:AcrR family transcriptional regulator